MDNTIGKDYKLCAEIISDVHFDVNRKFPFVPVVLFCRALRDAKKNNADALITVGDTTSRGNRVNWDYARKAFKKVPVNAKNIILTVGNHDCWSDGEDEYATGIGEYFSACKDLMGRELDKPYFATYINGYSFICMGNEEDMGCDAYISDTQLEWLRTELEKGTKDGKPAFVFCHQSLNGRHGLPRTWDRVEKERPPHEGGIGASSEQVAEILKSFKNVFYFSGHSHMGLCGEKTQKNEGYSTIQYEDGVHLINVPCFSRRNHHGEDDSAGFGFQLEIYSNRVFLRPKDFRFGRFIKSISIKDGKPYYEVELEK